MYIWLDFISKTGHVTYYYILWVFFTEALSQKRDKNKLRRHITDPPPLGPVTPSPIFLFSLSETLLTIWMTILMLEVPILVPI